MSRGSPLRNFRVHCLLSEYRLRFGIVPKESFFPILPVLAVVRYGSEGRKITQSITDKRLASQTAIFDQIRNAPPISTGNSLQSAPPIPSDGNLLGRPTVV